MSRFGPTGLLLALACGQPDEGPATTPAAPVADPAPVKRLTQAQFSNIINDLFAGDEQIASSGIGTEVAALPDVWLQGFANRTEVSEPSDALVEGLWQHALWMTDALMVDLGSTTGCGDLQAPGVEICLEAWVLQLAEAAWRRPLSGAEVERLHADFQAWSQSFDPATSTSMLTQFILQSPELLYVPEIGDAAEEEAGRAALSGHELATRLALLLYDGLPDAELLANAAQLDDPATLEAQVRRMLHTPRGLRGLADFADQWLETLQIGQRGTELSLVYPGLTLEEWVVEDFHQELQPAMRAEPLYLFAQVIREGTGTLAELLTTTTTWAGARVAELQGAAAPTGLRTWPYTLQGGAGRFAVFELGQVAVDPARRSGLLTTPGVQHAHAQATHSSPVLRGLLVRDRLLCEPRLPPPGDVPPLPEEVATTEAPITNRQRFEAHVLDPGCASCHAPIDGVGFTFEHYDLVGRWQDLDHGLPVDSSGELLGTSADGPLEDAVELTRTLAGTREVHDCFVTWWYRYALARAEQEVDRPVLEGLQQRFWEGGGDIPSLLVDLTRQETFRFVEPR